MWPQRLPTRRFLRYSLVGLAGVPLNLGALALCLQVLGTARYPRVRTARPRLPDGRILSVSIAAPRRPFLNAQAKEVA